MLRLPVTARAIKRVKQLQQRLAAVAPILLEKWPIQANRGPKVVAEIIFFYRIAVQ